MASVEDSVVASGTNNARKKTETELSRPAVGPADPPQSYLSLEKKAAWVVTTGGKQILMTLLPFVGVVLLWQLVVSVGGFSQAILPGPVVVFKTIGSEASSGILWSDLGSTFRRLAIGLLIGIPVGTIIGLGMGISVWFERLFSPLMNFGLATPGITFIPLAILLFGLGDLTVISILIFETILVVMLNTWTSVRGVDPSLLNAARTMGVNGATLFRRVLFPGSLLGVIGGYRMAFSRAWRVLIGGELLVGLGSGLGYRISVAQTTFQSQQVYAGIITIGVIGLLLERVILRSLETLTVDRWGGIRDAQ